MADFSRLPLSENVEQREPTIEDIIQALKLGVSPGPTSDPWTPKLDTPLPRERHAPMAEWLEVLSAMTMHPFALMEKPGPEPGKRGK